MCILVLEELLFTLVSSIFSQVHPVGEGGNKGPELGRRVISGPTGPMSGILTV